MSDRTYTVTAWPYLEAWPMRHTGNEKWPFKLDDKLVIIHADDLERLRSRIAELERVVEAARTFLDNCPQCDGSGMVTVEHKMYGGVISECAYDCEVCGPLREALRDLEAPCETCGGSGDHLGEGFQPKTLDYLPCPDCGGDDE